MQISTLIGPWSRNAIKRLTTFNLYQLAGAEMRCPLVAAASKKCSN